ncbi:oxygenase MpaB family protein [Saccharopolyspora taberi]
MDISGEALDRLAREGDPAADRLIADLARSGQLGEVNRLLREWQPSDREAPEQRSSGRGVPGWQPPARGARARRSSDGEMPEWQPSDGGVRERRRPDGEVPGWRLRARGVRERWSSGWEAPEWQQSPARGVRERSSDGDVPNQQPPDGEVPERRPPDREVREWQSPDADVPNQQPPDADVPDWQPPDSDVWERQSSNGNAPDQPPNGEVPDREPPAPGLPPDLPANLREFVRTACRTPEWADRERLARVREFFADDGIHVGTVLALGSMATAYAVPLGAKVMGVAHRLRYPERRTAASAQLAFDLMRPEPFAPGSRFAVGAVKVRLIHAAVRHHLRATGNWDEIRHGAPASQEQLLISWMAMSVQVLDFLDRLRIRVTAQEAQDYLHIWRVAGAFLGIGEEAMPRTVGEARQLFATALARSAGPSPEGVELTRHLLDLHAGALPGRAFHGVVPALLRRMVGKEVADWLAVPRSPLWQGALRCYAGLVGAVRRIEDRPLGRGLNNRLARLRRALELRILTRGRGVPLELPPELTGYVAVPRPRAGHSPEGVPILAVDVQGIARRGEGTYSG